MQSLSLASLRWRFRQCGKKAWRPATVPGCVHADLYRQGKIPDPFWGQNELSLQWIEECDWEYEARFELPASWEASEVVELVADGLDTVALITLNHHEVARTENMFVGKRWDVKPLLRRGANVLSIRLQSAMKYVRETRTEFTAPVNYSDPVGGCTRIRKQQCQFGWDWGPRFVTAGIWRDLRLEGWSRTVLRDFKVTQVHDGKGGVELVISPEWAGLIDDIEWSVAVSLHEVPVVTVDSRGPGAMRCLIAAPQLWWPAGQGGQTLYAITLRASDASGRSRGEITKRVGLRTIVLDQSPDEWGQAFQFVVNGRPVFIKGANWIPGHAFVATMTRADYARDLRAATEAHMNCVRLWGGGVYESEDFYDLCDELGLLVWHDFMFACALYPADQRFLSSVREEAEYQIKRVRHRACLALWCGNNEIPQLNWAELQEAKYRQGYEALFHELLPALVTRLDGATPYHPSTQWRGSWAGGNDHALGTKQGDTHFWDVWHARHPVKDYEKWDFRFVSEFGMQSFVSPETQRTFCDPADSNIFGPTLESHQKNRAGNQIILDYVSRRYRYPKNQDDLIYLSQLSQAHCIQIGVEHYRRNAPRCMGAIYWQLNDCWPVASWSSIEFTGRWKALHYLARRFYAPALVTAHVPGDEVLLNGNYRRTTIREVHLYTVYDSPTPQRGLLSWDIFHLDGSVVSHGKKRVALEPRQSIRQKTLDVARCLERYGRENLYLRIALSMDDRRVSEETVFLTPPRFLNLPKTRTKVAVRWIDEQRATLRFRSPVFQHRFCFDLPGIAFATSDNYFELYPGEGKEVTVTFTRRVQRTGFVRRLRWHSLADSYQ